MSLARECCLIFVIILVYITTNTEAVCCGRGRRGCGAWGWGHSCNDGVCVGTFDCCGRGKCNVFCCACRRGCRSGNGKRELVAGTSAREVFNDIDLNEDGKISLDEANEYLRLKKRPLSKRGISEDSFFAKMDVNNNGFIDQEEFDEDLKQFKK